VIIVEAYAGHDMHNDKQRQNVGDPSDDPVLHNLPLPSSAATKANGECAMRSMSIKLLTIRQPMRFHAA
jgi:hypothetical protein